MEKLKVLLVDDEERIRKGLKKLLEEVIGGYSVVAEAENGKKALECLLSCQIDLIFSDIRMPVMDGIEFIQKLHIQFPKIPVLILSGYDEYDYMRQAIKNNAVDYILKPIDRLELAKTLDGLKLSRDAGNKPGQAEYVEKLNDRDKRMIIRKIKDIIIERLHTDISLQEIADEVQYSYTHLSSIFKNETGQCFTDYLISIRIEKAKQLLKNTNLKVYEIGDLCGYPNPKYFMSIFKDMVGVTPSQYRDDIDA